MKYSRNKFSLSIILRTKRHSKARQILSELTPRMSEKTTFILKTIRREMGLFSNRFAKLKRIQTIIIAIDNPSLR